EGAKPKNWVAEFKHRRITVTRDLCRKEAAAVLHAYKNGGGAIYGARKKS
ncbi:MAG: nucleoside deaminase, partial [Nitrospira sp.]|nr:nucleoside deaminase [Nitrospira sp.]MBH0186972.1 nucleoside deaminase [Nitrospira sp.]